jgi:hypothetical protein
MMDSESPHYLKAALKKSCCREKGGMAYSRDIEVCGNDMNDVKRTIDLLSGGLL